MKDGHGGVVLGSECSGGIRNSTFRGVTATEVITRTGAISLKNVTIEPAKPTRGINSNPAPAATTNTPTATQ